jgi:hypothetical protein
MPILLIEHQGKTRAARVAGRVLIGRVAPGGIVLPDEGVSRIHAWIDRDGHGAFYIADASSRTGTIVDGGKLRGRHVLGDGDEVKVGSAKLTWRATEDLPAGVRELMLAGDSAAPAPVAGGVLFACPCGAPLWAPTVWAGRRGACNACRRRVLVPMLLQGGVPRGHQTDHPGASAIAMPVVEAGPATLCSVCQWSIEAGDPRVACPACGLQFHADCWEENRGCSAYGCAQVGVLDVQGGSDEAGEAGGAATGFEGGGEISEPDPLLSGADDAVAGRFPAEFLLFGLAVVLSILGLFAFGLPAALVACGANVYWFRASRRRLPTRRAVLAGAILLSLFGFVAGFWFSSFHWLGRPLVFWPRR